MRILVTVTISASWIIQLLSMSDTQAGGWSGIPYFRGILDLVQASLAYSSLLFFLGTRKPGAAISGKHCSANNEQKLLLSFHLIKKYSWESSICQHSKSIPSPGGLRWLLTVLSDSFWLNLGPNKTLLMLGSLDRNLPVTVPRCNQTWLSVWWWVPLACHCIVPLFVPPLWPELIYMAC